MEDCAWTKEVGEAVCRGRPTFFYPCQFLLWRLPVIAEGQPARGCNTNLAELKFCLYGFRGFKKMVWVSWTGVE